MTPQLPGLTPLRIEFGKVDHVNDLRCELIEAAGVAAHALRSTPEDPPDCLTDPLYELSRLVECHEAIDRPCAAGEAAKQIE